MRYKKFHIINYVNISKMCNHAFEYNYAIPQFNINNLEWAKVVLETCEEMQSPVILGVSSGANKYMGGLNTIVGMITGLILDLNITVPVALHLDHSESVNFCKSAIDAGFTSVMFDGSKLPISRNVKLTYLVTKYAHTHDVSVEAEVGLVGGTEDNVHSSEAVYASLDDVVKISKTGADVVAASYGSVHGVYYSKPKIGFDEIKKACTTINKPLVLHGASGLSDEIIKKAISCGEAKINVNTENQIAFNKYLRIYYEKNMDYKFQGYDPRKIILFGIQHGVSSVIKQKILLFGSNNRASAIMEEIVKKFFLVKYNDKGLDKVLSLKPKSLFGLRKRRRKIK